jgi:ribosomal protein S24E
LEINITKDWDNPLLDRKEITFNISHTGATPSRDEIKNKLVALLNSKHELVIGSGQNMAPKIPLDMQKCIQMWTGQTK